MRDSCYSSVTNSLLTIQEKRFRKNRNCSLAQESTHLAAATLTVDGCVNNIKFASYLTGNQPLTCKLITKRQRPSNIRTIFHVIHSRRKYGIRKRRSVTPSKTKFVTLKNEATTNCLLPWIQAMCESRLRCIVVASFSIWRWKLQKSADFDWTFRKSYAAPFSFHHR